MLEYKCDICDKVVAEAEHQGCGVHKSIAGAWDISINFDRRCEGEYCNGGNHMLVCDDCLERIKKLPWEEFTKIDAEVYEAYDAVTSTLMVKAMAVTGHFNNVERMQGLGPYVEKPLGVPDARSEFKHTLLGMVDGLHPDAFEKGVAVVKKLVKLGGKAHVKMFEKLEEFIENKAKKLFGVEADGNDDVEKPESDREDEKA